MPASAPFQNLPAPFRLETIVCCDSTNARLLERVEIGDPTALHGLVLLTEQQTAGRGRRGRPWRANPADSLTFSLLWHLPAHRLGGLSLAVGLAALRALASLGAQHLALKWPNDLLFASPGTGNAPAKLAGILIELARPDTTTIRATTPAKMVTAVIGVGINLRRPDGVDQPAAGLADCCVNFLPARADILATFLLVLGGILRVQEEEGFTALRAAWQAHHSFQDTSVILFEDDSKPIHGICRGVDDNGALLLEMPTGGGCRPFLAGDLHLRPYTVLENQP
jgi:BirA family biotin operon repressor/biotin-[acetyl-CoA-carboxylase] ligase